MRDVMRTSIKNDAHHTYYGGRAPAVHAHALRGGDPDGASLSLGRR